MYSSAKKEAPRTMPLTSRLKGHIKAPDLELKPIFSKLVNSRVDPWKPQTPGGVALALNSKDRFATFQCHV